ncbi:MAG: nuclear transport factor 2 family protein [Chloroflexota bacterium]
MTVAVGERLATWLAALRDGDGRTVVDGLADGVTFITPLDEDDAIIPYVGTHVGKADVLHAFELRNEIVETVALSVTDFGVSGDRGWALMWTRERVKSTGREFEIEAAHHFRFDADGRIVWWRSYFDPNPEVRALRTA